MTKTPYVLALGAALVFPAFGCSSDESSGGAAGTAGAGAAGGSGGSAGSAGSSGSAGSGGCDAPPRSIWTWDLSVMPPVDIQVPATCVGQGPNSYVYVADDAFGTDMTQAQVDTIVHAFENATPADPGRGIYAIDVETFGDPPDVDADPHIVLFYTKMGSFQGFTFDGFFRNLDQSPGPTSNQTEMLHLNAAGANAPDTEYMLGVVAHEFVHLIAHGYDGSEQGWLDEALAEAAMVRTGYLTDLPAAANYVTKTASTPLCVSSYSDYGATFSWGTYMLDRFGTQFLKDVLQDPADGRTSIEAHLPGGATFRDVFGEFMVACVLDQPGVDPKWGFSSIDVNALGSETAGQLDGAPHDQSSVAFGARVLRFTPPGAGTVTITLASSALANLVVHSMVLSPASPASASITPHDAASPITLNVAAGQVVDLVVAVDAGAALGSGQNPPSTTFTYTASHTP